MTDPDPALLRAPRMRLRWSAALTAALLAAAALALVAYLASVDHHPERTAGAEAEKRLEQLVDPSVTLRVADLSPEPFDRLQVLYPRSPQYMNRQLGFAWDDAEHYADLPGLRDATWVLVRDEKVIASWEPWIAVNYASNISQGRYAPDDRLVSDLAPEDGGQGIRLRVVRRTG